MSLKDYEIIKELGKGAFGSVWIVKRKIDGHRLAMKRVKISQLDSRERENALNEIRILASLHHVNIIGYEDAFYDEESKTLNIVLEFADDGDLESKIQKNIKSRLTFNENEIWSYLIQIVQGLKYLHDNRIIHRDIKCANVFTTKNGVLKLGDLNVSKILKMGLATTQTGTPYYACPEVWADKPYDYKSDVWSVGCVIYELCTLKPPFKGVSLEQLSRNVRKGIYDPIPSTYSKELSNIIGILLQTNPFCRPNCDFLLANEIIQRKMKELKLNLDKYDTDIKSSPIKLLNTIKMPRDVKEINQRLPKKKIHNKELEENNLMQYDVNINRKQMNPQIEFNAKENVGLNINLNVGESKELNSKNKERDLLINNLINRNKEINTREPVKEYIAHSNPVVQNQRIPNLNNVINPMANLNLNKNLNNNNNNNQILEKYQIKRDNNIMVRPSSGKKEEPRPKTPVQINNQKIEVRYISNNPNNYNIAPSNNLINRNKPVQVLASMNSNPTPSNVIPIQNRNNNLMKLDGVNIIQAKIDYGSNANNPINQNNSNPKNKDVNSRPLSANVNIQNNNKPIQQNNIIPQPNKILQEVSKNRPIVNNVFYSNDRSKSPNIVLRKNLNIPLSANSPRQKSPIKEKYLSSNPSNNVNNNKINLAPNRQIMKSPDKVQQQVKLINNNRVEIQKLNYDYIKMLQNADPKKGQNYHYVANSNDNPKVLLSKDNNPKINIKNNPIANNNIQPNQNYLSRPPSGVKNNGPKIVVINQRK